MDNFVFVFMFAQIDLVFKMRIKYLMIVQQRLLENIQKNEAAAKVIFPNEQWVDASLLKLVQTGPDFEIPKNLDNIKIAKSRVTPTKREHHISDNDARTLAKEIRQAKVLADKGASVFLLPKSKAADGRDIPGPDALVDGVLYEFKTITGPIDKVETRFRKSRSQSENVFLSIMHRDISKSMVISKLHHTLNNPTYKGGINGRLIVYLECTGETFFFRIKDLK